MLTKKEINTICKTIERYPIHIEEEIELYEAFHKLVEKYDKEFLTWYIEQDEYLLCIPFIQDPKSDMERDILFFHNKIKNPRNFTSEDIINYEKKVCEFLARMITNMYDSGNCNQICTFLERHNMFRHYYMGKPDYFESFPFTRSS